MSNVTATAAGYAGRSLPNTFQSIHEHKQRQKIMKVAHSSNHEPNLEVAPLESNEESSEMDLSEIDSLLMDLLQSEQICNVKKVTPKRKLVAESEVLFQSVQTDTGSHNFRKSIIENSGKSYEPVRRLMPSHPYAPPQHFIRRVLDKL